MPGVGVLLEEGLVLGLMWSCHIPCHSSRALRTDAPHRPPAASCGPCSSTGTLHPHTVLSAWHGMAWHVNTVSA